MKMSHFRIGMTFICTVIPIACGDTGGSKPDTVAATLQPTTASSDKQAPAAAPDVPESPRNVWPNVDLEAVRDHSLKGRRYILRVHMDIEGVKIDSALEDAVRDGNGAGVLTLIKDQTGDSNSGNSAGWATLKAALQCVELAPGTTCTKIEIDRRGSWPNPNIMLINDYEATKSPTAKLRVHMDLTLKNERHFHDIVGELPHVNDSIDGPTSRRRVLNSLKDDGLLKENDDTQKLGWRTLKSALGCGNRNLTKNC